MRARGIRSYHRPARLDQALELCAQGAVPLAGGTRLLAAARDLPNVLDLAGLDWAGLRDEHGDLVLGSMVTLQEAIDARPAWEASAGLLPLACRAQHPSRALRGMATLGGESVFGDPDSEVAAALLALNAVFRVARAEGELEIPAMRFLRDAAADLRGGALVKEIVVPAPPVHAAALERAAAWPSAPPLVAVTVTLAFTEKTCRRARLVFTGGDAPPARLAAAEARVEGTPCDEPAIERAAAEVLEHGRFRGDALASADYRRETAAVLLRRALRSAAGRLRRPVPVPRLRPAPPAGRPTQALPYFTSGRLEALVNGRSRRAEADARTSLLELLRREGLTGAKAGCDSGDCGACTVLLDNRPVAACLTLALRAHGRSVQTVEGLGGPERPHALQRAFAEAGAVQCGFCTPALLLAAKALLEALADPTPEEVRDALAGTLCRCVGAARLLEAVAAAALQDQARRATPPEPAEAPVPSGSATPAGEESA